jgi:metal-responsive CopG/Arc/MetJ family transcriptional regulator
MDKVRKIRITIDLIEVAYQRLEELAKAMGGKSKAEVVKDALQLLEFFVKKRTESYEFILHKEGEPDKIVEILGLGN